MNDIAVVKEQSPPDRLGRYAIIQNLAKGGMAQVFVAQKDGAEDICVLKQLLVELEEHETAAKRFHREAHVASFLIHPNIARVTDAGMQDDTFCIAMEFIAGTDVESMMHHLMRAGRMLPHEVSMAVALGALEGLAYAHDATDPAGQPLGLVHRDLSPRNIMLSYGGEVKLIDFGLAHGRLDDFKTAPGMILGTLRYVSPEQAMTTPVDRRSDLYSIAVVLHEMLTGRFLVEHGKPLDVLKTVITERPPLVSELNPNLPAALDPVLARGLEKEVGDRWQTAQAFRDALVAAAGPLAQTPPAMLGDFLRQLFPEQELEANRLVAQGRQRFARARGRGVSASTLSERDLTEATQGYVSPQDIGDPGADQATRTGFMPGSADPGAVTRVDPGAMSSVDADAPTRAGMVEPVPFDSLGDLAMSTRTAMLGEETQIATQVGDPADESTAVVRRRAISGIGPLPTAQTIPPEPLGSPLGGPGEKKAPLRYAAVSLFAVTILALGIGIGRMSSSDGGPKVIKPVSPLEATTPSNPGAVGAVASRVPAGTADGQHVKRRRPRPPSKPSPKPSNPKPEKPSPNSPEGSRPATPKPAKAKPPANTKPAPKGEADTGKLARSTLAKIKRELDGYELSPGGNRAYTKMLERLRQVASALPDEKRKRTVGVLKQLELCLEGTCFNAEAYHENTKKAYKAVRGAVGS